jgi:hypothetical protein
MDRIRRKQGSECGTSYGHHFGGLYQHRQLPLLHKEAADDSTEYNKDSDDRDHMPPFWELPVVSCRGASALSTTAPHPFTFKRPGTTR